MLGRVSSPQFFQFTIVILPSNNFTSTAVMVIRDVDSNDLNNPRGDRCDLDLFFIYSEQNLNAFFSSYFYTELMMYINEYLQLWKFYFLFFEKVLQHFVEKWVILYRFSPDIRSTGYTAFLYPEFGRISGFICRISGWLDTGYPVAAQTKLQIL